MNRINIPKYMEETGKSSQVASRECRYQFFSEVMAGLSDFPFGIRTPWG